MLIIVMTGVCASCQELSKESGEIKVGGDSCECLSSEGTV